ncbi:hypothetical protein HJC23_007448 [Cyclotella cryptica]|uniref:CARD domain-containing protein n=1 Tax=Cyclotella cryptica TaxID=29204 RepID=A0ABD3QI13_9STRA|eukprot:CCRYP_005187-RA/>CCRYP_005187-RA protein AED:0.46 eAED:0.46 QI:0/-1/0/1/-1/1/1/0/118
MSYTSADRSVFQGDAAREGWHIKHLISSQSMQTGRAIQHLITLGLLSREELLGIESLISNDAAAQLLKERRAHTALVLRAQKEMQEKNEENADKLAQFAICSSSKSIQKARLRAALAV